MSWCTETWRSTHPVKPICMHSQRLIWMFHEFKKSTQFFWILCFSMSPGQSAFFCWLSFNYCHDSLLQGLIAEVSERRLQGVLMLRLGYGGIRAEQSSSWPKLQPVELQTAKGSFRRPVLGPLNTRYQGLGSEPQWQELIADGIQAGQITSVNCQLKWQGQYQGCYKDQLWDYSKDLQEHKNKAHLEPHRETQMRSFQRWEKIFFCLEAAERQRLGLSQLVQLRFREVQEIKVLYSSWSFSCEAFTGGRSKIWLIFFMVLTALWL